MHFGIVTVNSALFFKGNMHKKFRSETGSAMLEMAIVLPLFLLLTAGVVEFSQVLSVKQVITNAAREGARAGAVDLDDTGALSTARDVSEKYIQSSGVELEPTTITPTFVSTGGSAALEVIVQYDYHSILTEFIPGIPAHFTLQSAAIMRRES